MTNYERKHLAHQALAMLQYNGGWMNTSIMRTALNLTVASQMQLRNVLDKLYQYGAVKRKGSGKLHWAINVSKWDTDNPFNSSELEYIDPYGRPSLQEIAAIERQDAMTPEETENADTQEESTYESPSMKIKAKLIEDSHDNIRHEKYDDSELRRRIKELEAADVEHQDEIAKLQTELKELREEAKRSVRVLEIKRYDGKIHKIKNKVLPKVFDKVLSLARCRRNILLVGPAGVGKTYLGELVAETLGLSFASISCTAGMSESHLLGRGIPNLTKGNNEYQSTQFMEMYENGGLFLLDELDSADPNLLLSINSAIANRYCNVPNRVKKPKAKQHDDFILIATANTFGRGATRMYAGRNQLDEATLDRFRIGLVECDYDEVVEKNVCPNDELRGWLQDVRAKVMTAGLRRVVSTRFMIDAYVMMTQGDWTMDDVKTTLFQGWGADEVKKVTIGDNYGSKY